MGDEWPGSEACGADAGSEDLIGAAEIHKKNLEFLVFYNKYSYAMQYELKTKNSSQIHKFKYKWTH